MYFDLKLLSSHCHHFFHISFLFTIVTCYHGNQTCWYPRICYPRNLVSLSFWCYQKKFESSVGELHDNFALFGAGFCFNLFAYKAYLDAQWTPVRMV